MPDIMITCPVFGKPVSTGLHTDSIKLETLPASPFKLRCPSCKKMHRRKAKDAWVDQKVGITYRQGPKISN
jgi:hypothetical protein